MTFQPLQQSAQSSPPELTPVGGGRVPENTLAATIALRRSMQPMNMWAAIALSMGSHIAVIAAIALALLILQFLGFTINLFEPLAMKEREIEFVLVQNPEAPPRDKNTKNRAEHATRSGGEKIHNKVAEQARLAGAQASKPQPKANPAPPAQKPAPSRKPTPNPRPQPVAQKPKPVARPVPSPQPTETPLPEISKTPPKPRAPRPVVSQNKTPTLPPNPIAPTIKTPAGASPDTSHLASAGPVIKTSGSSSGGQSGTPGPQQISGSPSSLGRMGSPGGQLASGSPGSSGGQGGSSSYSQNGSPGGGGGRPGIDALPEPDYGAWMAELQRRIKRNWRPPTAQEDKRVVVMFRVAKDGRLTSLNVKNSSGYPEADNAALAAVKLSAPFRPLPMGHRGSDQPVEFTFDYNVFRQGGGGVNGRRG